MTSFAEFRDAYKYRGDKVYELVYERHKYSLRGKRPEVVVRNLKLIFEHAFAISEQRGFYAMSLRDLSKSSELSIGALYGCIKSKNDIPSIACDTVNFLHTEFLQRYQDDTATDEMLMAHIKHCVYLAEIWDSWLRFLFQETQHLDDESRYCVVSLDKSHEELLVALIGQHRERTEPKNEHAAAKTELLDSSMISRAVISFMHEWCLKNEDYKRQGISVDRYASSLVDLVARLLK